MRRRLKCGMGVPPMGSYGGMSVPPMQARRMRPSAPSQCAGGNALGGETKGHGYGQIGDGYF